MTRHFPVGLAIFGAVLAFSPANAAIQTPMERIWIDADAACGAAERSDPDDCLAILALARNPAVEIVGISTVFGNVGIDATDAIARALAYEIARDGGPMIPVYRGAASAFDPADPRATEGSRALAAALADAPLTLVALGPLSNIADVLTAHPQHTGNITRALAIMGKREGHAFHPAEGADGGMMFGHGPIFRDFNICEDTAAAIAVAALDIDVILLPYELARQVEMTGDHLAVLAQQGGAAQWVAERAKGWLTFWQRDVGRDGFYPFDLLAAEYIRTPEHFACAREPAHIAADHKAYGALMPETGLLVGPARASATHYVSYCTRYLGGSISLLAEDKSG